jgi:hypothetical protein
VDPDIGWYHMVVLGLDEPPDLRGGITDSMQATADLMLGQRGLVVIAHPYWSGLMSKDLIGLQGFLGLEVYNGGCEVDDAKGLSIVHWDDMLAAGQRLCGLAVDDAHWRSGDKDAGRGWVWVKATRQTPQALLAALEEGRFYASTGPEILDLKLEGDEVEVRCSPVVSVDFVGDRHLSQRISAPPGETITEAKAVSWPNQTYLRVACQDAQGNWAWANPFYRQEGP